MNRARGVGCLYAARVASDQAAEDHTFIIPCDRNGSISVGNGAVVDPNQAADGRVATYLTCDIGVGDTAGVPPDQTANDATALNIGIEEPDIAQLSVI